MKKHTFLVALFFLLIPQLIFSKPVFIDSKYLIGCYQAGGIGVVGIGGTSSASGLLYPLSYFEERDGDSAIPSDYWIIKEEEPDKYSFQNAETLQYIKFDATATAERRGLVLVDQLQTDKATLFTMTLNKKNNLCYYIIHCATNSVKGWNKRTLYDEWYPVGVYNVGTNDNECFIFYTSSGNSVIDDGAIDPITLPASAPNLGAFKTLANSLTFGYKVPVVDTNNKQFFLTIPENQMGTNVTLTVSYELKNAAQKIYINNTLVNNGTDYTFASVQAGKTYTIEIRDGATVVANGTGTIIFSTLPLVQIYSDATIQYVYTLGRIVVTEPNSFLPADIDLSELRYRGATAASKPKKSYAIKLKNPLDGVTPMYKSFLGLRSDNNWILDAMYIDPGRMRNRVSTDLWNDFSTPPYFKPTEPNLINGTRGNFVEVFLNDSYNGLYCMTEKVDRKQLNVKKYKVDPLTNAVTQRGGMYKASSWSVGTLLGNGNYGMRNGVLTALPAYNNNSETWSTFEVKYPDFGDGEPIEWKAIYDAISVPSSYSSDQNFVAKVADYFDMPVFIDYYLFIELLLATDNHGKNTYLSVYDQSVSSKLTITPWDLDGTWGRRWEGSSYLTQANQSFITFIQDHEIMENNLYIRLRALNVDGYNTKLVNRYRELRGTYFTHEKLMLRFKNYLDKFKASGADTRERARWSIGSFDTEYTFLSNWVASRLSYLDTQYLGGPYTEVKDNIAPQLIVYPTPVRDIVTISNIEVGKDISIYSLQGNAITQLKAESSEVKINMNSYAPGIYIVKVGQKSIKIVKL